jgi:hypothetical protein
MSDPALDTFRGTGKVDEVFDPNLYANIELQVLKEIDLGKHPDTVMKGVYERVAELVREELLRLDKIYEMEPGDEQQHIKNHVAVVRSVVDRVWELELAETHAGAKWAGVGVILDAIDRMQKYRAQSEQDAAKNGGVVMHPSMYRWDANQNAYRSGIGSDTGRVRTYIGPDRNRYSFSVNLSGGQTMAGSG